MYIIYYWLELMLVHCSTGVYINGYASSAKK